MNYATADRLLDRGRNGKKKIANNTYLERFDDHTIAVRLHSTQVVLIHRNGKFTLFSGGWKTVTTKDRINSFSPARIFQKDFEWFIADGIPFEEGMVIDTDGMAMQERIALMKEGALRSLGPEPSELADRLLLPKGEFA